MVCLPEGIADISSRGGPVFVIPGCVQQYNIVIDPLRQY